MTTKQADQLAKIIFTTHPLISKSIKKTVQTSKLGIPMHQLMLLKMINKHQITINELASHCFVSAPTMSAAINLLVKKKLVQRRRSIQDRRVVKLHLTARGEKIMKNAHQQVLNVLTKQLSTLTSSEQNTVLNAMNILQKTFTTEK